MAEYIGLVKRVKYAGDVHAELLKAGWDLETATLFVNNIPDADVAPVVHGRWIECDDYPDDAYIHHKCSNCETVVPYSYQYREDWDEGMDGEWFPIGLVDDGIIEHITPHCPNCGALMDGGKNDAADS